MRKFKVLALLLVLVLIASVGCSPQDAKMNTLNFGAGGSGGSWYRLVSQLTEGLREEMPDMSFSVTEGGAHTNIRNVNEGKDVDMGIAALPDVKAALAQKGAFEEDGIDNVKVIMNFATDLAQFTTLTDSGIDSLYDVKDKRILPGRVGQGIEALTREVLALYDLDYETIEANGGSVTHASWSEAPGLINDNHIDLIAFKDTFPNARILEIEANNDAKVLGLEDEILDEFMEKHEGYFIGTIPAGTYKGQEKDANTVAHTTVFLVNGDVPDEVVYSVTKVLIENKDLYNEIPGNNIGEDPLLGITEEILHPGARQYFEEEGYL